MRTRGPDRLRQAYNSLGAGPPQACRTTRQAQGHMLQLSESAPCKRCTPTGPVNHGRGICPVDRMPCRTPARRPAELGYGGEREREREREERENERARLGGSVSRMPCQPGGRPGPRRARRPARTRPGSPRGDPDSLLRSSWAAGPERPGGGRRLGRAAGPGSLLGGNLGRAPITPLPLDFLAECCVALVAHRGAKVYKPDPYHANHPNQFSGQNLNFRNSLRGFDRHKQHHLKGYARTGMFSGRKQLYFKH